MKKKSLVASLCITPLLIGSVLSANAAEQVDNDIYLYEAAQSDLNLVSSYKQLIAPVVEQADWLAGYGTASPAQVENVDGTEYLVFTGCKPHDCPSQSYAVMYDPKQKQMVAGALVTNVYENSEITSTEINWLGEANLDFARALSKYLY